MGMTNFEIISTAVVWAFLAMVFFYYRSLAIKHQRKQGSGSRHGTRPIGEGKA